MAYRYQIVSERIDQCPFGGCSNERSRETWENTRPRWKIFRFAVLSSGIALCFVIYTFRLHILISSDYWCHYWVTRHTWVRLGRVLIWYDQIHRNFLLLVVRELGQSLGWSISVESVCFSYVTSGHMLLHNTKLVVSISADLLTWVYHTGGYSYMGGRYNRDYIHINTAYYSVQSRSLFLNKAELGKFISSFGSFHLLHNAQPFFLNTLSETTLLILRIYVKVWSLVALIVYDQLWHISLCRPLFWLGPLHV